MAFHHTHQKTNIIGNKSIAFQTQCIKERKLIVKISAVAFVDIEISSI